MSSFSDTASDPASASTDPHPPNADPQAGCALGCHGTNTSNAPPIGLGGTTDATVKGVGAHAQHVNIAASWHRQVLCVDCHTVPAELTSPGHIDGDNKAEVIFSALAGATSASWSGTTCTTHCHGSAALGGSSPAPLWTKVDGSQVQCGSCHGTPPPAPHPAGSDCSSCHPTMEVGSLTFRDPASHINGVVDLTAGGTAESCTSCHGSATSSAPPRALNGATANTVGGVGAHQAHLAAANWHLAIPCSSCHRVPATLNAPGHIDGDNISEVVFSTLNPAGVYTRATTTCSTQYCHGNGRGNNGTVSWVTPGARTCTSCHATNGTGMSGDHARHLRMNGFTCASCHKTVANANLTILNANLHINGVHEVVMNNGTFDPATRRCANTGCHGTETW